MLFFNSSILALNITMNLTEPQITQKSQECFDFWFNDVGVDGHNHGYMSRSCFMFEHVLPGMLKPASGHFMQMGTNFGISFDILYRQYGNRCIGIDLWNPLDHPNIIEKDIYDLNDMNVGFCNVDAGDFRWTPELRMFSIEYAMRNVVLKGGIIFTAGGDFVNECLGLNLYEYFEDHGFTMENYNNFTDKKPLPDTGVEYELIAISS